MATGKLTYWHRTCGENKKGGVMAEFIVFVCRVCRDSATVPVEGGEAETWSERGSRLCGRCLAHVMGVGPSTSGRQDRVS